MQRIKVKASKKTYTYSYLYITAIEAIKQARNEENGRFYTCMMAELFSALCIEAYLNHIGSEKIPYWDSVERKLGPHEKLGIICHEFKFKIDHSKRPFQSFNTLFQLRNSLAHGKTEYLAISEEQLIRDGEKPKLPETKWKSLINLKQANQFVEDTKNMIDFLHTKTNMKHNNLLSPESSTWEIDNLDND